MRNISTIVDGLSDASASQQQEISDAVRRELTAMLQKLLREGQDIDGALVTSVDGIGWAHALRDEFDYNRFAAMSSALLALADNLAQESNKGTPRNVLIEGAQGNVFIMHAGASLLLTVFTRGRANLGLALAHAKRTADAIGNGEVNVAAAVPK